MHIKHIWKPLCAALLVLSSGCWEPQTFEVMRRVPGLMALPAVHTLAVGEITGPGGEDAAHGLARALVQQGGYHVLDWSSPHGLGDGGWADGDGGWQTADAALLGALDDMVLAPHYSSRSAWASDGSEVTTFTRTVEASVCGSFWATNPRTGLAVQSVRATGRSTLPETALTFSGPAVAWSLADLDTVFEPVPLSTLHAEALRALVKQLSRRVAFTEEPTEVTLYHDKTKPELRGALQEAQKGHWQEALARYGELVLQFEMEAPSQAHKAHHNYGVALAMSGDLPGGLEELRVARSLSQDRPIQQMLERLERYRAEAAEP